MVGATLSFPVAPTSRASKYALRVTHPLDRDTIESVREVVEDVTGAGHSLSKVLAEEVADVGDGSSGIAELLQKFVSIVDGGHLVRNSLVHEHGHGWGAVSIYCLTLSDSLLSDKVWKVQD
jgi:hypothetical protein